MEFRRNHAAIGAQKPALERKVLIGSIKLSGSKNGGRFATDPCKNKRNSQCRLGHACVACIIYTSESAADRSECPQEQCMLPAV